MAPHQGGWSVSELILSAGQATADNLPGALADLQVIVRAPTLAFAEHAAMTLERNAAAVAAMTGCRYERHWVSKSRPGLANHVMARATFQSLQALGPPRWDEGARRIAREIQARLGLEPMGEPFIPECERLIDPLKAEAILRRDLPPSQSHSTSDDYTEMTWHAPTSRYYVARPTLRAPPGYAYPAWAMNALGGVNATIDPMVMRAAGVSALTALRLMQDEATRAEAKSEFVERTQGGIGGAAWIAPLCDYPPPIDFHWPEYVTTARGRDWWIPTPAGLRAPASG